MQLEKSNLAGKQLLLVQIQRWAVTKAYIVRKQLLY
jgi:hypothetical protein